MLDSRSRFRPVLILCHTCLLTLALGGLAAQATERQGPSPITGGQTEGLEEDAVAGGINAIAAHPTNADIVYIAAVNGGVWKTQNATSLDPDWVSQTDAEASLSMGDIVFDTADPTHQTLVAGFGRFSSYGRRGGEREGLLRTDNGGSFWTNIGPDLATRNVSKLAVHGDRMVAAINIADDFTCDNIGIYRSADGGASFDQRNLIDNGIPRGVSTVVSAQPGAPDVLYAAIIFADTCDGG